MTPGRMITEQNIFSKNKNEGAQEATQGKLNQNKPISFLRLHQNLPLEKDEKALFGQQKT